MAEVGEVQTRSVSEVKPMSSTIQKESQGRNNDYEFKSRVDTFKEKITTQKVN